MEPTQAYDLLPSLEPTQCYNSNSILQAAQDFTLDPTNPPEPTQAFDENSKAAQDFTLEPTQAYFEPGSSSPSLSQTPKKSYSDYAKTPPMKPIESNSLTSPSLSFSTSSPNLGDRKKSLNSHLPKDEAKKESRSQLSNLSKPEPNPDGDKRPTSTTTSTLKVLKKSSESWEIDENDSKGDRKPKREAPSRKRKREAPSRKQKQPDKEVETNSRKTKRTNVSRDQNYDEDLRKSIKYVKACIDEVAEKLEKKRYKALCKKVSKQLVHMWSKRKPSKKRSIERWLQRRHVKIVRLVEKYIKMDLV